MAEFDVVIVGAGAAGLSLAYHLGLAGLDNLRVALVERASKAENDRTWCFWERGPSPFEPIIYRDWARLAFFGDGFERVLDVAPYRYKMLRGIDFYRFMSDWLERQPGIARIEGDVTEVAQDGDGARVMLRDGRALRGRWAFNSALRPQPAATKDHHALLQHFLGWVIQTPECAFDPDVATLMDFRVEQAGDARFVYVMPFDPHTALVEYTVFSPAVLPREGYVGPLSRYIRETLGIERFEEQHEEFGVIPMTDAPFPARPSPNVFNIGTAGGRTKPSTGYTFRRIQQHSAEIAAALKATGSPVISTRLPRRRYELFDSALLNVLETGRDSGRRVFTDLFARNTPQRVFRFLDEETSLIEDLQIMTSVNMPAFLAGTADAIRRRL